MERPLSRTHQLQHAQSVLAFVLLFDASLLTSARGRLAPLWLYGAGLL